MRTEELGAGVNRNRRLRVGEDVLDAAADIGRLRKLVRHHRAIRDVLEHLRHVAEHVPHAERGVGGDFAVDAEEDLIGVGQLRLRVDGVRADTGEDEMTRHAGGRHAFWNKLRESSIEVVTTGESIVG